MNMSVHPLLDFQLVMFYMPIGAYLDSLEANPSFIAQDDEELIWFGNHFMNCVHFWLCRLLNSFGAYCFGRSKYYLDFDLSFIHPKQQWWQHQYQPQQHVLFFFLEKTALSPKINSNTHTFDLFNTFARHPSCFVFGTTTSSCSVELHRDLEGQKDTRHWFLVFVTPKFTFAHISNLATHSHW